MENMLDPKKMAQTMARQLNRIEREAEMIKWNSKNGFSDVLATPLGLLFFVIPAIFGAIGAFYGARLSPALQEMKYGFAIAGFFGGPVFVGLGFGFLGFLAASWRRFYPPRVAALDDLLSAYEPFDVAAYTSLRGSDRRSGLAVEDVLAWVRIERGALLASLVDPWFYGSASSIAKARSDAREC